MTEYNVSDIIKDVRTILELNVTSDWLTGISDTETLSLDKLIESKIEDGAYVVEMQAPHRLLDGISFKENTPIKDSNGFGYVKLPKDFARLVLFQMNTWLVPVFEAIYPEDAAYTMLKSKFACVSGNYEKPAVAIVNNDSNTQGGLMLEYYRTKDILNDKISHALYIPMPTIKDGKVKLCYRLYRPVLYSIASLVSLTYKDNDLYNAFQQTIKSLITI